MKCVVRETLPYVDLPLKTQGCMLLCVVISISAAKNFTEIQRTEY